MKARDIYRNLSGEPWWAAQTNAARWLASRYYAGIDSCDQLLAAAQPIPIYTGFNLKPIISMDLARQIIRLR